MKLAAATDDELRQELRSVSANGLFVPADPPHPLGARVMLRLSMADGTAGALAEAVISRHTEHENLKGMLLRITRWESRPASVSATPSTPGDDSAPPRIATPSKTSGGFRLPPSVAGRVATGSTRAVGNAGNAAPALSDLAKTLEQTQPLLADSLPDPTPAHPRTPPPYTPIPRKALSGERRALDYTPRPPTGSHRPGPGPGAAPARGGPEVGENEPTPPERMPAPQARSDHRPNTAPPLEGKEPKTGGSAGSASREVKTGDRDKPESRPGTPGKPAGRTSGLRSFDVLGQYQILKRLGGGGMADVHLARAQLSEGVDKLVALKTVLPQFGPSTPYGSMFLHEARISATLQHPNLVQVFAFGESAGYPYLAMEYIHGRDLSAVLKLHKQQKAPINPAFTVALMIELCKALTYVHEKKDLDGKPLDLVHRDVSPANVVLSSSSEVKLMDFGVAAANSEGALGKGLMIGKAEYMPLEQAIGGKPAPAWDLFSLGVVLYELLTLRRPYPKVTAEQFVQTRRTFERIAPRDLNRQLSASLSALALTATHPDPERRFSSARELRQALEEQQAELGPCDVGGEIQRLFGAKLKEEEEEIERLMGEARQRAARRVPAFLAPLLPHARAVRRKIAGSRLMVELSRRPALRLGLVVGLVLLIGGGGLFAGRSISRSRALTALISQADAQLQAGRLVGPAGDEALGRLLEARALATSDERVQARLTALAQKFDALADAALQRGNRTEAAAHLQAALQADPNLPGAKEKLAKIETEIRDSFKGRVVKTQ